MQCLWPKCLLSFKATLGVGKHQDVPGALTAEVAHSVRGANPPAPPGIPRHQPGTPLAKGSGRGPWPTSETPPCGLTAREGKKIGQLWVVAHRTRP